MEYYKFLFIILIFTLFSHSFSEKQENHNSEIQKLHQFLEEPETESENTNEEEEEEDYNENEEEEEGDNHKKEEEKENNKDYDNGSNDSSFVNVKCLWVNKYNVYSLQKLQLKDDDYKKGINNNELVIFNFCQNTNTKSELESTALWQKNNKYIKIAGSIDGKTDINRWDEIHDDTGDKGLFITLAKGEECQAGINHQTFLRIVCDENNEIKKQFERFIDRRGILNHLIRDGRQFGDFFRDMDPRIDERVEFVQHMAVFDPDRTDLDDMVIDMIETRGLDIESDEFAIDRQAAPAAHRPVAVHVVHVIAFYSVDDFDPAFFCFLPHIRENLNIAMVRDRHGGHSPICGTLNKLFRICKCIKC